MLGDSWCLFHNLTVRSTMDIGYNLYNEISVKCFCQMDKQEINLARNIINPTATLQPFFSLMDYLQNNICCSIWMNCREKNIIQNSLQNYLTFLLLLTWNIATNIPCIVANLKWMPINAEQCASINNELQNLTLQFWIESSMPSQLTQPYCME